MLAARRNGNGMGHGMLRPTKSQSQRPLAQFGPEKKAVRFVAHFTFVSGRPRGMRGLVAHRRAFACAASEVGAPIAVGVAAWKGGWGALRRGTITAIDASFGAPPLCEPFTLLQHSEST
jgi:hypothetical protein